MLTVCLFQVNSECQQTQRGHPSDGRRLTRSSFAWWPSPRNAGIAVRALVYFCRTQRCGMQPNQQVTFLPDGGEDVRDLPLKSMGGLELVRNLIAG
jgi:hypothetical protein